MLELLVAFESWLVVLTTLFVIMLCVVIHYEMLSNVGVLLARIGQNRRWRILALIATILITHVVEIWLFAFYYVYLTHAQDLGSLVGLELSSIIDYTYYSAMVYTTVGFGDIRPEGLIRFTTGMEALTGLVMITWSASFTFLEMQRHWREG